VRKYGFDYPDRLRKAGLEAVEDTFVNELTDGVRKRHGLVKGEIIYRGNKK
jgi:ABC-type proline/glycine betaine transport system ATPase subunit